ncbi:hypothetical protein FBY35_0252 [Streptomyces sp. SLBN-118]|nr:hypothetical protein FBY35_0252 [Streptomyces sp. SLBN-118]
MAPDYLAYLEERPTAINALQHTHPPLGGPPPQAVDAFAEGHERALRLAVRQEEAARREFIDDLLYGRLTL